jgi:hypothetical protein
MGCFGFFAGVVLLLAISLALFMLDSREASVKADSILFKAQTFDERFELRTTEGSATQRYCYVDLPLRATDGRDAKHQKHPIMFLIHGKHSNADDMKTLLGPEALERARSEGFLVVYPVGILKNGGRTWNAGSVDAENEADDVAYFTVVVAYLAENYNADPQSVFIAGMSNGGFMTHLLACAWATSSAGSGDKEEPIIKIQVRAIAPTLGGLGMPLMISLCRCQSVSNTILSLNRLLPLS